MPEREGRLPAFYDHETEEPRATGRRRRQVADSGVDEHVFDRMPSRRFGRRGELPARRAGEGERFGRARREAQSWDDAAGWEEPRRAGGDDAGWEEPRRAGRDDAGWEEPRRA